MKKVCQSLFFPLYTPEVSVNRGWTDKGEGGGYNDHCCLLPGERELERAAELRHGKKCEARNLAPWHRRQQQRFPDTAIVHK